MTQSPLNAFKATRYFSPMKLNEMQPSASDIDSCAIPFLNNPATITSLKEELPVYLAKADDVSPTVNVLDWWKQNEHALVFSSKKGYANKPSAAAERVFSLLNNSFGSRQQNSLEDYVEASIILQYSKR